MNSFDWQKAWQRRYNNASDDKWKTKSLNPMQPENYEIKLAEPTVTIKTPNKVQGNQREQKVEQRLPSPTLTKINETMFCISLQRELNLFYLPPQNQDRILKKSKKTFSKIEFKTEQKISKITGLTTQRGDLQDHYILVGTSSTLILLKIVKSAKDEVGDYSIKKIQEKDVSIPDFRIFLCFGGTRIIAVSSTLLYEFQLVDEKLKEIVTKKIEFANKADEEGFKGLTPIGLVAGYGKNLYYFGSKEDKRLDVNKIKGAEENPKPLTCQALTIVKLKITGKNDIQAVSAEVYPIDYIFDLGMFNRTKIFEIQQDTFLFSLHQEIVLIKKNFNKYIVWDNVSVVSSKSQSRKGQLILVAQTILVYSEPVQIFAHQIYFDESESKLKMPTIDNFKGNENQQIVLYDALMLSTEDSIMKVLVYTKQVDVIYPGNLSEFRMPEGQQKNKQPPTTLEFTMICINQNDPKKKLQALIVNNIKYNKPTTQQIDDFCQRFVISPQDLTKCKWNVSQKKLKDIENILMLIKDDDFIKSELDNILKQESHDLNFLGKVEDRQLERLNGILIEKMVQFTEIISKHIQREESKAQLELKQADQQTQQQIKKKILNRCLQKMMAQKAYIFGILQWMMESEMFRKKVNYSSKFLTFKEYDFIEIGKLRAASLKEEIKLLSEKKYVKRLKHFINEFKNLVIANFEEVFSFLLTGKSVAEIHRFIREFPFVLPKFRQDSQVFMQRMEKMKRGRLASFSGDIPMIVNNKFKEKSASKEKGNVQDSKMKESRFQEEKMINETRCYLWGEEEQGLHKKQPTQQKQATQKNLKGADDEERQKHQQANLKDKDKTQTPHQMQIPQTLQVFFKKRSQDIRRQQNLQKKDDAVKYLGILLEEFQNNNWFKLAAFKQHCMITKTSQEIKREYFDLKKDKSFLILMKFLYGQLSALQKAPPTKENLSKLHEQKIQIRKLLEQFIKIQLVPESFVRNVDARIQVYELLKPLALPKLDKKTVSIQLPKFQDFLVKSQPEYFAQIFEHLRPKILTQVMSIYDKIHVGFFRERFEKFLSSDIIKTQQAIDFLDEFTQQLLTLPQAPKQRYKQQGTIKRIDEIRFDVYNTIKKLLKLTMKQQTLKYVLKALDKAILPEKEDLENATLKHEAKIPLGFYFYNLFVAFKLDYTYEQLINFTAQINISDIKILNQLVQKYCRQQYEKSYDSIQNKQVCILQFQDYGMANAQRLPKIDIHGQPLQFFGLLLIFHSNLDFAVQDTYLFELMMQNYLNLNKFKQLSDFISKLHNYHITPSNMNTKNYQMISQFKEDNIPTSMFIRYTLHWIERQYHSITNVSHLADIINSVERALNMLEIFDKQDPLIKKQRALFILLTYLRNFSPRIVVKVEEIKDQAQNDIDGFIFLMHMFQKIGVEKFTAISMEEDYPTKVQNFFKIFEAHQEYVDSRKVDYYNPHFIRFLIEVCLKMIEHNKFEMARYLILYKIPNDKQYFMDVILMFLAASDHKRPQEFEEAVSKQILAPETTSLIKNNLQNIITRFDFTGFIPTKPSPDTSGLLKADSKIIERPEEKLSFYMSCESIFWLTLKRCRTHDAFFFLVRAKIILNESVKRIPQSVQKQRQGRWTKQNEIQTATFFLVTTYVKCLHLFIQKEFYPTFNFFSSKVLLLGDVKARMDVIKDINIAMSKLDKIFYYDDRKQTLQNLKKQLQAYYLAYMKVNKLDPDLKLVDYQAKGASETQKAEVFARSNKIAKEEQAMEKQISKHKKVIQENINKAYQVQEAGRFNVLNKEINQQLTQIKNSERHAALEANLKREKESKQVNIAERKARELEEIKRKEKEEIQSIKDTYQSNTTKRVTDLIENLRKKREEAKARTYIPATSIREESERQRNMGTSNFIRNLSERQNLSKAPQTSLVPQIPQFHMQPQIPLQTQLPQSSYKKNEVQQISSYAMQSKKVIFEDIVKLYREKESEEALKCIQKYEILKNAPVRGELIKRAFGVTHHLDNFLQFLKYLIDSDHSWKESIEQKSIPIATQMLKMQPKQKLTIKQIIPVELFTKVMKISLKDYYTQIFEIFKPKMIKILEKELMAVHAVGILFRYSLGSENRFYNKVFYEYLNVILNTYQLKNYDDKEVTLLAEKIRSNYNNLPDNKTEVLERLLQKIASPQKKTRLLEALMKILERKGESIVGGQSNKQIAFVVQRLMKA